MPPLASFDRDPVHFCGMGRRRIGEALALRWSDVDLDEGVITVPAHPRLCFSDCGLKARRQTARPLVRIGDPPSGAATTEPKKPAAAVAAFHSGASSAVTAASRRGLSAPSSSVYL
jgi:hypothetical protein